MNYPKVYQAVADIVRDQSRVPDGTPAIRLPGGQELAVVTLTGYMVNLTDPDASEPSPAQWAERIVACLNACHDIADPVAFMGELRKPVNLRELKPSAVLATLPEASARGMLGALYERIWPEGAPS